ncbi:ATPase, T2SS/T4P/T4SS family [Phytomonospora sp. NPDC050363]|uniref:ATPase, T2SS/T4P/T4SS family n=1 Tax=Phytomonospora sp. NPDC050363 TaxID=3155642 RepID=UPI0033EC29EB
MTLAECDARADHEITLADMVPRTLRWGVRRIIVGEVRSREIVPMLQAMAVSQGSLCTIHAGVRPAATS